MVSPFAIYFHGVLGLDLDWIQGSSVSTWTIQFFRPNLLETSKSNVIEVLETSDIILIFAGILGLRLARLKFIREDCVKMRPLYKIIIAISATLNTLRLSLQA